MFNLSMFMFPIRKDFRIGITEKKEYKEQGMFKILTPDSDPQDIEDITPSDHVVICTSDIKDVLRRTLSGTMSYTTDTPINLSGSKIIGNAMLVREFNPILKISSPAGVLPRIVRPIEESYINALYRNVKIDHRGVDVDNTIPSHLIYSDFEITTHFDINELKKIKKSIVINNGSPLFNIELAKIYYVGATQERKLKGTVLIKNTEVYNNFENIF